MEDDSNQNDCHSEEIRELGSASLPDSDSLDNPYRLETIKLQTKQYDVIPGRSCLAAINFNESVYCPQKVSVLLILIFPI